MNSLNLASFVVILLVPSFALALQIPACSPFAKISNGSLIRLVGGCLNCDSASAARFDGSDGGWRVFRENAELLNQLTLYKPGTVFRLKCHEHFQTSRGSDFTVCLDTGNWSPQLGVCAPVVGCLLPKIPMQGEIRRWSPGNSVEFRPGNVIEYSCPANYVMKGSAVIACTEDGKWTDDAPECVQSASLFQAPYWAHLSGRPSVTAQLCPDSIHGLLPDPDNSNQAIVICFNGLIKVVKMDCESVVWSNKVEPPHDVPKGVWYAAIDRISRRFFFTLTAKAGIFWASYDDVKLTKGPIVLQTFVGSDDRRSFYGLAVDERRRLLYSADPIRGAIGIWSLENPNSRKFIRTPPGEGKFQPAFIALSSLPPGSKNDSSTPAPERLIAVSDWNNDQIHVFRQRNAPADGKEDDAKVVLDVSHEYLGTIADDAGGNPWTEGATLEAEEGAPLATVQRLGKFETPLGSVDGPLGLHFDAANNLIVADYLNHRIQIFDLGRDYQTVEKPLFRPSWASAELNSWTIAVMTLLDQGNTLKSKPTPLVMAGIGSGDLLCFKN